MQHTPVVPIEPHHLWFCGQDAITWGQEPHICWDSCECMPQFCYFCFKLFEWYSSASPSRSLYPSVQCCKQLFTFGLFQSQCFGDSIKVKFKDCFQCSVLSLCFAQFLLQNRIIAVILVRGGHVMDALHNFVCHMPKVFLGSWND